VLVAAADHLEQVRGGFAGHREVAEVDLCGYPHRSTCADTATMPTSSPAVA